MRRLCLLMKRAASPGFITTSANMSTKKTNGSMKIGTHDGTFHCDEVLACWMLKQLPEYENAKITRTRDMSILNTCDIVVDVGGVYDPNKNRYDHHQRSFTGSMSSLGGGKWVTRLSSAGLVYLHKGKQLLSKLTDIDINDKVINKLYDKVYEKFIEEVDAIDNGVDQFDGEPRYQITTLLSSRIAGLNPSWNEKDVDIQERFNRAMEVCGMEFLDRVKYYQNSWLPARTLVEEAIEARYDTDETGEIIKFSESGCPWKEHLFDIESSKNLKPTLKFILYPDQAQNWRVQCVPKRLGSFENRVSLIEKWRGIKDEALSNVSNIPGCIFVHASGFIGGNKTYDGALEMAKASLRNEALNGEK